MESIEWNLSPPVSKNSGGESLPPGDHSKNMESIELNSEKIRTNVDSDANGPPSCSQKTSVPSGPVSEATIAATIISIEIKSDLDG
jgi:hypothetical protein